MKNINADYITRLFSVVLFAFLTIFGAFFFVYLVIYAHSLYSYLLAFSYLILMLISGFFNIFTAYAYYRSYFYYKYLDGIKRKISYSADKKSVQNKPSVAIVMSTFNEDTSVVKRNLQRLLKLNYPKEKLAFYLLDDSTEPTIITEMRSFCGKLGIKYIHRQKRRAYKAGALNNMLKYSKEDLIAYFDYDEYLVNLNFVQDLVPYFADKKLTYIQTEKSYAKGNFFSDTVALIDGFFFKFVQPARALDNTAIFAGSCGIIRRKHLVAMKGFPEYITEDSFFSFETDMNGYKSLYLPKVYALGKPITTFTELVRQQWRYNYGGTQFISYFAERLRHRNKERKVSRLSIVDYAMHGFGLNYISVIAIIFTIFSILVTFSQLPIVSVSISQLFQPSLINLDLEIFGMGVLFASVLMPMMLTKIYFGSFKKGIMFFFLTFALVFVRAKAAAAAVFKTSRKIVWDKDSINGNYGKFVYAFRNSLAESSFSLILMLLGAMAMVIGNLFGGFWLLWYAALYLMTPLMFYKYG
ncbi:MAG: glycosyltransferase [Candidatus Marsarchaeota archaeon]|nr:glycosyltransferase [Candidatus Marsarchaeota archaeon]